MPEGERDAACRRRHAQMPSGGNPARSRPRPAQHVLLAYARPPRAQPWWQPHSTGYGCSRLPAGTNKAHFLADAEVLPALGRALLSEDAPLRLYAASALWALV